MQVPDKQETFIIRERMEQTGIDDSIECPADFTKRQDFSPNECCRKTTFVCLPPGSLDRPLDRIKTDNVMTTSREKEGIIPGPTSDIKHGAGDLPRLLETDNLLLRPSDIPGRPLLICLFKELHNREAISFQR